MKIFRNPVAPGNLQGGVPACPKCGVTVLFCYLYTYVYNIYYTHIIYTLTAHIHHAHSYTISLIRIISYADVLEVKQPTLKKGALKLWGMRWPASTGDSYECRWTKSWKLSYRLVVDMINHMYFISMTVYVRYTDPTLPQLRIDPARREKELPKILLDAMLWCGHFVIGTLLHQDSHQQLSKIALSGCCFLYSNLTTKNGGHTTYVADRTDGHQATGRSFIGNSSDR